MEWLLKMIHPVIKDCESPEEARKAIIAWGMNQEPRDAALTLMAIDIINEDYKNFNMNQPTAIESLQERYETGLPVFRKLFELKSADLKKKLQQICGNLVPNEELLKDGSVKHFLSDDEPEKIEIWYYDYLSITAYGINYNPEHSSGRTLIEFTKFFKIPD